MLNIKSRLHWIDALKGVAMCMVIFGHCDRSVLPSVLQKLGDQGQSGVQMFFLISAFLTFLSLDKYFQSRDMNLSSILKWGGAKLVRLIPLYYFAVVFYAVFTGGSSYGLGVEGKITVWNFLAHIFFVNGFFPHYIDSIIGVEWYIAILVIFYFVAPFLYRYIDTIEKSVGLFIIAAFIGRIIGVYGNTDAWIYDKYIYVNYFDKFSFTAQFPVMCLGIVFYFLYKDHLSMLGKSKSSKSKVAFCYMLIALIGVMVIGQSVHRNRIFMISEYSLFGVWYMLLMIALCYHNTIMIDNPVFRFLGRYSYAIYLTHYFLIMKWDEWGIRITDIEIIDWIIKFIMIIGVSGGSAYILINYVEKPALKWIRKNRVVDDLMEKKMETDIKL